MWDWYVCLPCTSWILLPAPAPSWFIGPLFLGSLLPDSDEPMRVLPLYDLTPKTQKERAWPTVLTLRSPPSTPGALVPIVRVCVKWGGLAKQTGSHQLLSAPLTLGFLYLSCFICETGIIMTLSAGRGWGNHLAECLEQSKTSETVSRPG